MKVSKQTTMDLKEQYASCQYSSRHKNESTSTLFLGNNSTLGKVSALGHVVVVRVVQKGLKQNGSICHTSDFKNYQYLF